MLLLNGIRKHAAGLGLLDDVTRMFTEASRYADDAVRIIQRVSDITKKEKNMDTPILSEIRKTAYGLGTLGTAQGQAALQSALGSSPRAVSNTVAPGVKRTPVQQMLSPAYHKAVKRTAGRPPVVKRVLRGIVGGPRKAKIGY